MSQALIPVVQMLVESARHDCKELLYNASKASRYLYCAGGVLLCSACFHMLVLACDRATERSLRSSWTGSVSWRKPILFAFSSGVTCASIGWVVGLLGDPPGAARSNRSTRIDRLSFAFSVGICIEVGLISMQTWRGVPSHFNHETPFDSAICFIVDAIITGVSIMVFYVTWLCFTRPLCHRASMPNKKREDKNKVDKDEACSFELVLCTRIGMVLLSVGCMFGAWTLYHGG